MKPEASLMRGEENSNATKWLLFSANLEHLPVSKLKVFVWSSFASCRFMTTATSGEVHLGD